MYDEGAVAMAALKEGRKFATCREVEITGKVIEQMTTTRKIEVEEKCLKSKDCSR